MYYLRTSIIKNKVHKEKSFKVQEPSLPVDCGQMVEIICLTTLTVPVRGRQSNELELAYSIFPDSILDLLITFPTLSCSHRLYPPLTLVEKLQHISKLPKSTDGSDPSIHLLVVVYLSYDDAGLLFNNCLFEY